MSKQKATIHHRHDLSVQRGVKPVKGMDVWVVKPGRLEVRKTPPSASSTLHPAAGPIGKLAEYVKGGISKVEVF